MSPESSCQTCEFAEPTVDEDDGPGLECRRFPPQILVVDGHPMRAFPGVDASDWCGEWSQA